MQEIIYLAVALVASAAVSPTELRSRGFAGFGPTGVVSSQGSQQQASSASGSNFNLSPYGSSASQYRNDQASSSSYSNTQVVGAFSSIASQLSQMQTLLAGGSLSYQAAQQQVQQLASSFQTAFSQLPQCGGCLTPRGGPLLPVLSGLFSQFTNVMSAFQSSYSGQFSSLVSPLASMSSQWSQFFQSASQSGVSLSAFLPANFGSVFGNIVPGLFPGGNTGFFSSQGSQQQASAASGSNFNTSPYGGPVPNPFPGGNTGVFSSQGSQQQASGASGSNFNLSPYGGSASQYRNSQSSSSSYKSTQVVGAFSNIASQLSQMQSLLASGSLSYQVAQQQVQQLASSFQTAFLQLPQCGGCLTPRGGPLLPILSGLFSQFTNVMSAFQSSYSGQFSSLVSPLSSMSSQWSQFFQSASQSGVSLSSFLPANFGSVFGNIVPGLFPAANVAGF